MFHHTKKIFLFCLASLISHPCFAALQDEKREKELLTFLAHFTKPEKAISGHLTPAQKKENQAHIQKIGIPIHLSSDYLLATYNQGRPFSGKDLTYLLQHLIPTSTKDKCLPLAQILSLNLIDLKSLLYSRGYGKNKDQTLLDHALFLAKESTLETYSNPPFHLLKQLFQVYLHGEDALREKFVELFFETLQKQFTQDERNLTLTDYTKVVNYIGEQDRLFGMALKNPLWIRNLRLAHEKEKAKLTGFYSAKGFLPLFIYEDLAKELCELTQNIVKAYGNELLEALPTEKRSKLRQDVQKKCENQKDFQRLMKLLTIYHPNEIKHALFLKPEERDYRSPFFFHEFIQAQRKKPSPLPIIIEEIFLKKKSAIREKSLKDINTTLTAKIKERNKLIAQSEQETANTNTKIAPPKDATTIEIYSLINSLEKEIKIQEKNMEALQQIRHHANVPTNQERNFMKNLTQLKIKKLTLEITLLKKSKAYHTHILPVSLPFRKFLQPKAVKQNFDFAHWQVAQVLQNIAKDKKATRIGSYQEEIPYYVKSFPIADFEAIQSIFFNKDPYKHFLTYWQHYHHKGDKKLPQFLESLDVFSEEELSENIQRLLTHSYADLIKKILAHHPAPETLLPLAKDHTPSDFFIEGIPMPKLLMVLAEMKGALPAEALQVDIAQEDILFDLYQKAPYNLIDVADWWLYAQKSIIAMDIANIEKALETQGKAGEKNRKKWEKYIQEADAFFREKEWLENPTSYTPMQGLPLHEKVQRMLDYIQICKKAYHKFDALLAKTFDVTAQNEDGQDLLFLSACPTCPFELFKKFCLFYQAKGIKLTQRYKQGGRHALLDVIITEAEEAASDRNAQQEQKKKFYFLAECLQAESNTLEWYKLARTIYDYFFRPSFLFKQKAYFAFDNALDFLLTQKEPSKEELKKIFSQFELNEKAVRKILLDIFNKEEQEISLVNPFLKKLAQPLEKGNQKRPLFALLEETFLLPPEDQNDYALWGQLAVNAIHNNHFPMIKYLFDRYKKDQNFMKAIFTAKTPHKSRKWPPLSPCSYVLKHGSAQTFIYLCDTMGKQFFSPKANYNLLSVLTERYQKKEKKDHEALQILHYCHTHYQSLGIAPLFLHDYAKVQQFYQHGTFRIWSEVDIPYLDDAPLDAYITSPYYQDLKDIFTARQQKKKKLAQARINKLIQSNLTLQKKKYIIATLLGYPSLIKSSLSSIRIEKNWLGNPTTVVYEDLVYLIESLGLQSVNFFTLLTEYRKSYQLNAKYLNYVPPNSNLVTLLQHVQYRYPKTQHIYASIQDLHRDEHSFFQTFPKYYLALEKIDKPLINTLYADYKNMPDYKFTSKWKKLPTAMHWNKSAITALFKKKESFILEMMKNYILLCEQEDRNDREIVSYYQTNFLKALIQYGSAQNVETIFKYQRRLTILQLREIAIQALQRADQPGKQMLDTIMGHSAYCAKLAYSYHKLQEDIGLENIELSPKASEMLQTLITQEGPQKNAPSLDHITNLPQHSLDNLAFPSNEFSLKTEIQNTFDRITQYSPPPSKTTKEIIGNATVAFVSLLILILICRKLEKKYHFLARLKKRSSKKIKKQMPKKRKKASHKKKRKHTPSRKKKKIKKRKA